MDNQAYLYKNLRIDKNEKLKLKSKWEELTQQSKLHMRQALATLIPTSMP